MVASNGAARVARVYDQHDQFLTLESSLFTLGLPDTYLQVGGWMGGWRRRLADSSKRRVLERTLPPPWPCLGGCHVMTPVCLTPAPPRPPAPALARS